tara:strand:- start:863 stop:1039 length:177 start_codon:yes stop_codon:yes gene_type:complete
MKQIICNKCSTDIIDSFYSMNEIPTELDNGFYIELYYDNDLIEATAKEHHTELCKEEE